MARQGRPRGLSALGARQPFDSWENEPTFVTRDPLGNPVDKNHPWNKVTLPKPQKRDFTDKYTWVVSPRIYDKRTDTQLDRLGLSHRREGAVAVFTGNLAGT